MYWSAFSQCREKENHVAPSRHGEGKGRAQRARRKERNVMSKPVYITADSTCDLTPALLERFHVKTIPLHIVLGEENYLDGVDFTQEMTRAICQGQGASPDSCGESPGVYRLLHAFGRGGV